jgi:hypothetical protein
LRLVCNFLRTVDVSKAAQRDRAAHRNGIRSVALRPELLPMIRVISA